MKFPVISLLMLKLRMADLFLFHYRIIPGDCLLQTKDGCFQSGALKTNPECPKILFLKHSVEIWCKLRRDVACVCVTAQWVSHVLGKHHVLCEEQ